jgi:S1-C subfamily serine protease
VALRLEGPYLSRLSRELGAMLVALGPDKRLAPAFAPLDIAAREMRPGAGYGSQGELQLDLSSVPSGVDRLILVLHLLRGAGAGISFRDFSEIAVNTGQHRFAVDLANRGEAALIMLEIYRRDGGWRMSASGQGFVGGLRALQNALGIELPMPANFDGGHDARGGGGGGPYEDQGHPPRHGMSFSGSGFAIDDHHILTNAHVVEGAHSIAIAGERISCPAELVFSDPRNDIALLRVQQPLPASARFRDALDLHLGEDVIVLGFPLQGLLGSGPQATAGNVSALCGIGSDTSVLQFSAPIASGNSGGPILDQSGLVIGLVHASLNLDRVREGGSNAENVNFGVKGAVVRAFLGTVGMDPMMGSPGAARSRADIVRDARSYIFRIKCEG